MRLDPDADRRRELLVLMLRELRAARAAALAEGAAPEAISELLDERIELLSDASCPAGPVESTGPAGHAGSGGGGHRGRGGRDDLEDGGGDPLGLGGIGQ